MEHRQQGYKHEAIEVIGFKILDKDQDIYTASSSKNILKNV
jgi:hypothetical protein